LLYYYTNMLNEESIKELEQKHAELLKQAEAIAVVLSMYKRTPAPKPVAIAVQLPLMQEKKLVEDKKIELPKKVNEFVLGGSATVLEKILAIIKHEGRFLYRKEIIDLAVKHNRPFTGAITSALSQANSNLQSELALYMYQRNAGVWGLKSWITNGQIIAGRKYIENNEYKKR
jgi:hypothetical protein